VSEEIAAAHHERWGVASGSVSAPSETPPIAKACPRRRRVDARSGSTHLIGAGNFKSSRHGPLPILCGTSLDTGTTDDSLPRRSSWARIASACRSSSTSFARRAATEHKYAKRQALVSDNWPRRAWRYNPAISRSQPSALPRSRDIRGAFINTPTVGWCCTAPLLLIFVMPTIAFTCYLTPGYFMTFCDMLRGGHSRTAQNQHRLAALLR